MKKYFAVGLIILILLSQFTTPGSGDQVDFSCGATTLISGLLRRTNLTAYSTWIKKLSGEVPVKIARQAFRITTRSTTAMFYSQTPNARAFDYVEQQVRQWYIDSQVKIHTYPIWGFTGKNLVVELPGTVSPNEVIILSAHLDSTSGRRDTFAPGADDNGTGSAALLEAARLLRNYRFQRTIRLIWFTGEEQGLYGSGHYVNDLAMQAIQIVGVINMDMFGYDQDEDHCFELHVGELPASDLVGQCFTNSISAYGLSLSYDFIQQGATDRSDHASFWGAGIGAIEVLENYTLNELPGGCVGTDRNPNFHRVTDTLTNMNPGYAFEITKAGIATIANLAGAEEVCLAGASPHFTQAEVMTGSISLTWSAQPFAAGYRVFRSPESCGGEVDLTADVSGESWSDHRLSHGQEYHYWVEGVDANGCFSLTDGCASLTAVMVPHYFPLVTK